MKKTKAILASLFFLSLLMSAGLFAAPEEEIEKIFDKKDEVRFKLVLGDCQLEKSSDGRIHVHLVYSYEPEMNYTPKLEERGDTLYLEEKARGENLRGYSLWTVAVPDETEITYRSATGDLFIEGLDLEIDGNTGTGKIELKNVQGRFDLTSGTGNVDLIGSTGKFDLTSGTGRVEVSGSEGDFEISSGTGRVIIENSKGNFDATSGTSSVRAEGPTIEYEGNFTSGTADVEVAFPDGADFELTISSGTNDAVLEMNGKPIEGYFEFKCLAKRGRILSPVKFDDEEEYEDNGHKYLRKSFTKGKNTPEVYIKTGSGTARLVK